MSVNANAETRDGARDWAATWESPPLTAIRTERMIVMGDIRSPRLLYFKGLLFVVIGALASVMLVLQNPSLRTVVLVGLAVWGFARAYYFAFYVIEHYIDGEFKFAGLWSFLMYLVQRRG